MGDYSLVTNGASLRFGVPFTETDTVYFGGGVESLHIREGSIALPTTWQ
jgi:outer membrane protein insertion porin family